MKKALSILLVMVLLLATLPLAALSVAAAQPAENLLLSGDFETRYPYDWTYYQYSYTCGGAALHGNNGALLWGDGGWGALLTQTVPVTLGQAYHLEFWYKVKDNGFNWRLEQGGDIGLYESRWETATEWTHVTYDFVASSEWVTLNFCGSGNGIPEQAFVDDIVICRAVSADFDGYLSNGSFENGGSGWDRYQATMVSEEAAYFGDYGAHLQGYGGWGALLEQTFATKSDVEYTVAFFYKVNQNGFNMQIKSNVSQNTLAANWFTDTEWGWGSLTFIADGDTTTLNICGGGNGIAEDAYIDEIYIMSDGNPDDLTDDGYQHWKRIGGVVWREQAAYATGKGVHLQDDGVSKPMMERAVATIEGEEYTLSFWYQANAGGVYFDVRDGIHDTVLHTGWYDAGEWTQEEIVFTATSGTTVLAVYSEETGVAEDVYLDEVVLTTYAEAPAPIQEVKNGDFETGSPLGWSVYQHTVITPVAAGDGNYGAHLRGDGGWGALLEQGFFTTPGSSYRLLFSYKVLSNGFNLRLVDGSSNDTLAADWYTDTDWTQGEIFFTASSDTIRLNICGGGNGIFESAYIDDIVLIDLSEEEPDDPIIPDLPKFEEIVAGETVTVTVDEDLGAAFLIFAPEESGWYRFVSSGEYDPYVIIMDERGEIAMYNDNDGDGNNFHAVIYCEAGALYLLMLAVVDGDTFDLTAEAVENEVLFSDTTAIAVGDTSLVEMAERGVSQCFRFVPDVSGEYTFYSTGDADTYCFLYDVAAETVLLADDDFIEEENYNFSVTYDCEAGQVYYFLVSTYDEAGGAFHVTLSEATELPDEPETLLGDVDGDGLVNNRDLGLLQQYLNHWGVEIDTLAADVNGDGEVNNRDPGLLQQYLNDWEVELG